MGTILDELVEAVWRSELTDFLTFFLPVLTAFLAGCVVCRLLRDRRHARELSEQARAMTALMTKRAQAYDDLIRDVRASLLRVTRAVRARDSARAATRSVAQALRERLEQSVHPPELDELREQLARARENQERLEQRVRKLVGQREEFIARVRAVDPERQSRSRERSLEHVRSLMADLGGMLSALEQKTLKD